MQVATMVSRLSGFSHLQFRIDKHLVPTHRELCGNLAAISSHITMSCRWAVDLVTTVSSLRERACARRKATA